MKEPERKKFHTAIEEHSIEGLEVIQESSSFFAHGLLYIVLLCLSSLLAWAFFSKLDIIVSVQGHLEQESGVHKIYPPADGELVDMYVAEGVPVGKNEIIARVKSAQAIQIAIQAKQAKFELDSVVQEKSSFPEKQRLFDAQIASISKQIQIVEKQIASMKAVGSSQLTEEQKHKLTATKAKEKESRDALEKAWSIYEKIKNSPLSSDRGDVSARQLKEKEKEFNKKKAEHRQLLMEYEELEQHFSNQNLSLEREREQEKMKILELQHRLSEIIQQRDSAIKSLELKYATAISTWQAMSKIEYSDIDKDNFLIIRAPIDGEVIQVNYTQKGNIVKSSLPIAILLPKDSIKILSIIIPDKDRGLLRVGQKVKVKFNAFPFHIFGIIKGEVEYLSSTAKINKDGVPYYKGYVSMEKYYYKTKNIKMPLRYGMLATAEIIVQQRRIIGFAINPLKKY